LSKKKRQQGFHQTETQYTYAQCPVAVPEVVNMDETALVPDEELFSRLNQLESDRLKVIDGNFDPYLWEIEIAYLRRESQIRRQRREAHEAYLYENAAFLTEEDNYVDGNFDKRLVN
jgi:hypothetical protein